MKYLKRFNENKGDDYLWEKEFKILSIKYGDLKILSPDHSEFNDCVQDCIEHLYHEDVIEINSVQRLVDGEIFTLGDMLYMNYITDNGELVGGNNVGIITKIWPSFDQMRADCGRMGVVLNHTYLVSKVRYSN